MDPCHEDALDFDPLDVTKVWPEDVFPLHPVGRMVLNQNPDNFFNENEQLAFCPGIIVPGVAVTEDKLLQTRIFSYADTQRYRLGPNYLQIPVNMPKCPHHNNHHDGAMNTMTRTQEVNYFPSRHDPVRHAQPHPINAKHLSGTRERRMISKENNFAQAGARFRSLEKARAERLVSRIADALASPRVSLEVRRIWIGYWSQCDPMMGRRIAQLLQAHSAL